jgi:BirA family biotin operon repressor/biotin-[acetyl-CoA-carboxylase] ligase
VRVGHRQALNTNPPYKGGFFYVLILLYSVRGDMLAVDLRHQLMPHSRNQLGDIDVYHQLPSTQSCLLARTCKQTLWQLVIAETQTAGIGRHHRFWSAGKGQVSFSLGGWVKAQASSIGLLSLLASLCVRDVLTSLGLTHVALKWPNDVLLDQKKIAGILISISGKAQNKFDIVLGIGLNRLRLPKQVGGEAALAVASLSDVLPTLPDMPSLVAWLVDAWFARLPSLDSEQGCADLISEWQKHAIWLHQPVMLRREEQSIEGVFQGLTRDGRLRLLTSEGEHIFSAGEVSLRPLVQFN